MDTVPTTRREARSPRRRNRGTIIKLTLAGFALVGIGAAATSAAWTDSAYFKTDVKSAQVDLQGRLKTTTPWFPANDAGTAINLGATGAMVPGDVVTRDIELWNAGTAPLKLTWATAPSYVVDASCYQIDYPTLPANLPGDPAGGTTSITTARITITLKSTAPQGTCANKSATLSVVVQGTTL